MFLRVLLCALVAFTYVAAGDTGVESEYVGGTVKALEGASSGKLHTTDDLFLAFTAKAREIHIAYDKINLLEYGQNVSRRYLLAVVISPIFVLSKKRRHYLTIGYQDTQGKQQAMVLQVDKRKIRAVLVALEARTGLKVQFQDEEARKAGKG
jgi:hypothetical protein